MFTCYFRRSSRVRLQTTANARPSRLTPRSSHNQTIQQPKQNGSGGRLWRREYTLKLPWEATPLTTEGVVHIVPDLTGCQIWSGRPSRVDPSGWLTKSGRLSKSGSCGYLWVLSLSILSISSIKSGRNIRPSTTYCLYRPGTTYCLYRSGIDQSDLA